jgi:hypothetical protein
MYMAEQIFVRQPDERVNHGLLRLDGYNLSICCGNGRIGYFLYLLPSGEYRLA